VASPPKLSLTCFNIDVFLVGFFPEFFIRDYSVPPNSTDVSQAPINERLQFPLNLSADQPYLTQYNSTDFTHELNMLIFVLLRMRVVGQIFRSLEKASMAF
jgi:hypothetical protein